MQIDSFNCTILMDVVEKKQLGFFFNNAIYFELCLQAAK